MYACSRVTNSWCVCDIVDGWVPVIFHALALINFRSGRALISPLPTVRTVL